MKSFIVGFLGGQKTDVSKNLILFRIGFLLHWGIILFIHFKICALAEDNGVSPNVVFYYFWFVNIVVLNFLSKSIWAFGKKL